jgi:NCAIR mutase (PurE)-related protein
VDAAALRALVEAVRSGEVTPDDAVGRLSRLPYADLGIARVDHHRALRQGMAEAVYGPGKAPEHCSAIVAELLANGTGPVLLTRANEAQVKAVLADHPEGTVHASPAPAHATVVWRAAPIRREDRIVVVTAGTADLPIADECCAVLDGFGFDPVRINDAGVAGIHRLLAHTEDLAAADAVVAIAGMEGALASVVGGLTDAPVVAVPSSVGYGAGLDGVTALLAMLASCAAGITVVGIDNGYGAACAVVRILS